MRGVCPVFSFARHAAVDALIVYGVLWAVLTVMISTWALLAARRVRKRRAAWVAAEVDALLREAAGSRAGIAARKE